MMVKTSELVDDALDWAVALAEGMTFAPVAGAGLIWFRHGIWAQLGPGGGQQQYVLRKELKHWADQSEWSVLRRGTMIWRPAVDGRQAVPILERLKITTRPSQQRADGWEACTHLGIVSLGHTLLEAGMRCAVQTLLGDEVDIPEELMK